MNSIEVSKGLPSLLNNLRNVTGTVPEDKRCLPEFLQDISHLVRVKSDVLFAAGTDNIVVTLEPTERLIEFVSAGGAIERENDGTAKS